MQGFLGANESVGVIETASDHVFLKNVDPQCPFFGNSFVHHCPAKPLSMIVWIKEQAADFVTNKGDKADNKTIYFGHPCFGESHVHVSHIVGLVIEKCLSQKWVCQLTCGAP